MLRIVDHAAGVDYAVDSIPSAIRFLLDLQTLTPERRVPPPVLIEEVGTGDVGFRLRLGRNPRISAPYCRRCTKTLNNCPCAAGRN